MLISGKRAFVTGGSRGIGAAIARTLAVEGADVAISYEKSVDLAEAVVRDIRALGRNAVALKADNADVAAIEHSVQQAAQQLGGLDILVNNAGILRVGDLKDMPLTDIDAILNINVRAPIVAAKAALAYLGEGGRIISIGSYFADRVPASVLSVYAGSKSALIAFTKGLARELAPKGITANLVQPGSINTDMNPSEGPYGDVLRQFIATGKYGTGDDVANLVAFLASDKAAYITGSSLTVDGGATA